MQIIKELLLEGAITSRVRWDWRTKIGFGENRKRQQQHVQYHH
jgi:hypothetical protein